MILVHSFKITDLKHWFSTLAAHYNHLGSRYNHAGRKKKDIYLIQNQLKLDCLGVRPSIILLFRVPRFSSAAWVKDHCFTAHHDALLQLCRIINWLFCANLQLGPTAVVHMGLLLPLSLGFYVHAGISFGVCSTQLHSQSDQFNLKNKTDAQRKFFTLSFFISL